MIETETQTLSDVRSRVAMQAHLGVVETRAKNGKITRYHKVTSFEQLLKLVSLSASSGLVESIIVLGEDGKTPFYTLQAPTIHAIFSADIESLKSATIRELQAKFGDKVYYLRNVTGPAFIGCVDKDTHQVVEPIAWKCHQKIVTVNEFKMQEELLNPLLSLMEGEVFSRSQGIPVYGDFRKDAGNGFFIVEKGTLTLKTQSTFMIFTMYPIRTFIKGENAQLGRAILSRCLTVPFELDLQTKHEISMRLKNFEFKMWTPKPKTEVSFFDYQMIEHYALRVCAQKDPKGRHFLRLRDALLRTYATLGCPSLDNVEVQEHFDLVSKLKIPEVSWEIRRNVPDKPLSAEDLVKLPTMAELKVRDDSDEAEDE